MPYEIDFLAVGEESKSGDAIALRYGNLEAGSAEQTVVVVDGGFASDGERLVEHIARYYGTTKVDLVISTHPDADHINGLKTVLEQMDVGEMWMHLPWNHSSDIASAKPHQFSRGKFSDHMTRSLVAVAELEEIASMRAIPIVEPFTGVGSADGGVVVVGPTREFYEGMLTEMERGTTARGALASLVRGVRATVSEVWSTERLTDEGETSPSNNSSVITLFTMDDHRALLTGDAGIPALDRAANVLESLSAAQSLRFVQIPHHGSRRNVGPSVLNRILGPIREQEVSANSYSLASAAKEGAPKHPAKVVTNAFIRRGFTVAATTGRDLRQGHGIERPNWTPVDPLPFYELVEEDV